MSATISDAGVWDLLAHEYGRLRGGPKLLARDEGSVSHRTAEGWLQRRRAPGLGSLLRIAASRPDLADRLSAIVHARIGTTTAKIAAAKEHHAEAVARHRTGAGVAADRDGWGVCRRGASAVAVGGPAVIEADRRREGR